MLPPKRVRHLFRRGTSTGIYLPDQGFGVRIEDEVLITETGALLLTDGLPRTAKEVERWMAARPC